jgi:4-hydroxy-3-methylbut-2-enyl diphosphate reductase IspH
MAYEARNANPDKKLYITNEIIHNPEVNQVRSSSPSDRQAVWAAAVRQTARQAVGQF